MKKKTSQRQLEACRKNGAKGGPKTAQGCFTASLNSTKHNLTSTRAILLDTEDLPTWNLHRGAFYERYQPYDHVENLLVDQLAFIEWRFPRAWVYENTAMNIRISKQEQQVNQNFANPGTEVHMAEAFNSEANQSRALALAIRYENSLERRRAHTLKTLLELQELRRSGIHQPAETEVPETPDWNAPPPQENSEPPAPEAPTTYSETDHFAKQTKSQNQTGEETANIRVNPCPSVAHNGLPLDSDNVAGPRNHQKESNSAGF